MEELRRKILDENIKLHGKEAGCYDRIHPEEFNWFEQARIRADLLRVRSLFPGTVSCLDAGCGTGNLSLKLLGLGFEVLGVDISPEMIGALQAAARPGDRGRARFVVSDIDSFLDGLTETFDLVTASSFLHHLPDYSGTLLKLCSRIRSGGGLYITHEPAYAALAPDPLPRKALWRLDDLAFSLIRGRGLKKPEGLDYHYSDYQLYHGFDERKVLEALESAGMKILRFIPYASTMRLGVSCWLDTVILRSRRQFSLIARKI